MVLLASSVYVCVCLNICASVLIFHSSNYKNCLSCVTTMRARVFLFLLHAFYCLVIVVGLYCTALLCVVVFVVAVAVAVVGQS